MDNLTVKIGLNSNAVKTGISAVKDQFSDLKKFAGNELVQTFGAVGLVAGIGSLIDKGSQINDLAQRFGVSAEGLQRIGNAAKQNGGSLESVAAAMNKIAINQEKVRGGDTDLIASLTTLKVSAEEFINLSPEDAVYRMADAMMNAADRGAAYKAVIDLMGKKSGDLVTTLEMGSDAIKELGDEVGVFSDDTISHLDDLGDAIDKSKNRFAVAAGSVLVWVDKVARTVGAVSGGMWDEFFGSGKGAQVAAETVDDIWNPKKDGAGNTRPRRDVEEDAAEAKKAATERERQENKVADLRERLAEMERQAANDQLKGQAQINAMIEQRDRLLKKAADANAGRDAQGELEAKLKAGEIDKQIRAAREKADDEARRKAEQIADKRGSLENKAFRNSIDNLGDEEKKTKLTERRAELMKKLAAEQDPLKKLDLGSDVLDLDREINGLGKKKDKKERTVDAGDLTKHGGGGIAFFTQDVDPNKRTAKATEKAAKSVEKSERHLQKIVEQTKDSRWSK